MMNRKRFFYFLRLIGFAASLLLIVYLLFQIIYPAPNHNRDQQRLMQWGHDTPRLQDIPNYAEQLSELPFDGLVLDIATPNDGRGLSWTLFESPVDAALLADLREQFVGYAWGNLTDNFLRVTIYNPDLTWDDWNIPLENLSQIAAFAKDLGFKGIMFDTEQYGAVDLFDYPAQQAKADRSFEAYRDLAFQRGIDTMQALQNAYPDITIIYTYGITQRLTWFNSSPLNEQRYGLLVPFIEGMISSAAPTASLIDGYEASYLYRTESEFLTAYKWIRGGVSTQLADGQAYRDIMQAGFGLWIDPYCGDGSLPEAGCGFTQDEFLTALSLALQHSDRYVWLYDEHIDWFDDVGISQSWWDVINQFKR